MYEPTPEEIREECAKIQASWSDAERVRHDGERHKRVGAIQEFFGVLNQMGHTDRNFIHENLHS